MGLFDAARDYVLQYAVKHAHWCPVTSSLPLLGSGFNSGPFLSFAFPHGVTMKRRAVCVPHGIAMRKKAVFIGTAMRKQNPTDKDCLLTTRCHFPPPPKKKHESSQTPLSESRILTKRNI
jgi:hypothetical protein